MSQDSINEQAVKPEDGKKKPEPRRPGGKTKRKASKRSTAKKAAKKGTKKAK